MTEQATVEELIEVCKNIPKKWGRKFPSHSEDYRGIMIESIMKAIVKHGEDVDPPLVRTIIIRACVEYTSWIPVIRIPPSTGRRHGGETLIWCSNLIDEIPAKSCIDCADTIDCVCGDERDRTIIDMRLEGLTYEEIGESLKISKQRVGQLVTEIRKRFNDTKSIR